MNVANIEVWIIFNLFVFALLAIDNLFLAPRDKVLNFKQALLMTAFWVSLALIFNLGVWFWWGKQKALEFLAGYLIEQSLSVDNLFVFLLIFSYFKVSEVHQRKVLFWGILGAQAMRAIFILLGVALLNKFHWLIYIFGLLLVVSGFKLFSETEKEIHPDDNPVVKLFRRCVPVSSQNHDGKFWIKEAGKWVATPLFVVLVVVETTDLIFAIDSIPAVLAITKDPFIVYSSNIFAILGLRAMYFALSGLMNRFHLLHYGLGIILIFVGLKMLLEGFIHVPIGVSLGVIVGVLTITMILSAYIPVKKKHKHV